MATFEEHCLDCERLIGDPCGPVHRWIDAHYATFGALHRFKLHHWRGVEEAGIRFGPTGRRAAIVHILKDCGHVPKTREWSSGVVDHLGMKGSFGGHWDPVAFKEAATKLLEGQPDAHGFTSL